MKRRLNFLTNKRASSRRVMGVLITVIVIALLLLSGPATAFDLAIDDISDSNPTQGDEVTFTATAEVASSELVPIQNLSLEFDDGTICYFEVDGSEISGCTGITITQSEDSTNYTSGDLNFTAAGEDKSYGSGFGYGYAAPGPSRLVYDVTLDTDEFDTGDLTFTLNAHMQGDTFSSDEATIDIDSESSGGGGGGSSIVYNPSTSQTWSKITPGAASIMKVSSDDFGIKQITITVKNPAQSVNIVIEKLPGKPASVTKSITGKVFRYLKINAKNLDDSNLNGNADIDFKIPLSWLTSNGVEAKNMVLKRFNNENWQDLFTTHLNSDSAYAYFRAETPGFSYFAIGEKSSEPVAVPKVEELITASEEEEEEVTGEVTATPEPEEQPTAAQPEKKPITPPAVTTTKPKSNTAAQVAIVVIVVAAIGLIILSSTRRRKGLKPIREIKG